LEEADLLRIVVYAEIRSSQECSVEVVQESEKILQTEEDEKCKTAQNITLSPLRKENRKLSLLKRRGSSRVLLDIDMCDILSEKAKSEKNVKFAETPAAIRERKANKSTILNQKGLKNLRSVSNMISTPRRITPPSQKTRQENVCIPVS